MKFVGFNADELKEVQSRLKIILMLTDAYPENRIYRIEKLKNSTLFAIYYSTRKNYGIEEISIGVHDLYRGDILGNDFSSIIYCQNSIQMTSNSNYLQYDTSTKSIRTYKIYDRFNINLDAFKYHDEIVYESRTMYGIRYFNDKGKKLDDKETSLERVQMNTHIFINLHKYTVLDRNITDKTNNSRKLVRMGFTDKTVQSYIIDKNLPSGNKMLLWYYIKTNHMYAYDFEDCKIHLVKIVRPEIDKQEIEKILKQSYELSSKDRIDNEEFTIDLEKLKEGYQNTFGFEFCNKDNVSPVYLCEMVNKYQRKFNDSTYYNKKYQKNNNRRLTSYTLLADTKIREFKQRVLDNSEESYIEVLDDTIGILELGNKEKRKRQVKQWMEQVQSYQWTKSLQRY